MPTVPLSIDAAKPVPAERELKLLYSPISSGKTLGAMPQNPFPPKGN